MAEPVILEVARTPFAKRNGAFRETRPDVLLAHALRGLAKRAGIDAAKIEDVVTGAVQQVGEQGANVGRLGVLLAGFPVSVPAVTLNRMCGSSQQVGALRPAQEIAAGYDVCQVRHWPAGIIESMTRVPMFCDIGGGSTRSSTRPCSSKFDLIHQGEAAERIAEKWQITRRRRGRLLQYSAESHRKSVARPPRRTSNKEIPADAPGSNRRGRQAVRAQGATRAFATSSTRPK